MAAKDKFHEIVKLALHKDGWLITHDPLYIRIDGVINMYIDLGASKIIAAQKGEQKIAVEIKSFTAPSAINEFHGAVGQYINYRYALEDTEPDRVLYLAVSLNIYNDFFSLSFIRSIVQRSQINLLVYDAEKEEIERWEN